MKCKLFFTIVILTTIHQSFSMTPAERENLNEQLKYAIEEKNEVCIASLIQAGADINAKDILGNTSLHNAAQFGDTATIELLLAHGADINAKEAVFGSTPLHVVEPRNSIAIAVLIAHGADIDAKDYFGNTPLHEAAMNGDTATVELLLSKGADINAKGWGDQTSLYGAAQNRKTETVKLLLSKGAYINPKRDLRVMKEMLRAYPTLLEQPLIPIKKIFEAAIEYGYYDLVKLLLQRGLKPEISDLQLAKAKWQTAEHKQAYKAIGRLLVAHFQLTGELKAPEKSAKMRRINPLKRLKAYFRRASMQGPISKTGIVNAYGLPRGIAQNIATFIE